MNSNKGRPGLIAVAIVLITLGTAIVDQLRLPMGQRTWHGVLWGRVPYDLRFPTWQRVQEEFWNKDTSRLLTPHAFGVGWGINFYPIFHTSEIK